MHIQLEFMLDRSYEIYRVHEMLVEPKIAHIQAKRRMAVDSELRRSLRRIMENPKK